MRMVYLLILIAALSGCKDKPVQKVILTPTPQPTVVTPIYHAPATPKIDISIKETSPKKAIDMMATRTEQDNISTPVPLSIKDQAQAIYIDKSVPKKERIKSTRDFLNSQNIRWIELDYTSQQMTKWDNGEAVKHNGISSALNNLTLPPGVQPKGNKTPHNHDGVFAVFKKESRHWSKEFKVWMIRCSFFFGGHAIHDCQPKDRKIIGHVGSHGCDRVLPEDNPYNWDHIGTIVFGHD